jgi:hypothetical protein
MRRERLKKQKKKGKEEAISTNQMKTSQERN